MKGKCVWVKFYLSRFTLGDRWGNHSAIKTDTLLVTNFAVVSDAAKHATAATVKPIPASAALGFGKLKAPELKLVFPRDEV